mmetsp:Transcript_3497/g.7643  ORF Transcript_3497/g.7643 Transcript_3497/m.7643 type:complete len:214 (-) Transcript_3497:694-1335(-)
MVRDFSGWFQAECAADAHHGARDPQSYALPQRDSLCYDLGPAGLPGISGALSSGVRRLGRLDNLSCSLGGFVETGNHSRNLPGGVLSENLPGRIVPSLRTFPALPRQKAQCSSPTSGFHEIRFDAIARGDDCFLCLRFSLDHRHGVLFVFCGFQPLDAPSVGGVFGALLAESEHSVREPVFPNVEATLVPQRLAHHQDHQRRCEQRFHEEDPV